jgi:hypothetical protein
MTTVLYRVLVVSCTWSTVQQYQGCTCPKLFMDLIINFCRKKLKTKSSARMLGSLLRASVAAASHRQPPSSPRSAAPAASSVPGTAQPSSPA